MTPPAVPTPSPQAPYAALLAAPLGARPFVEAALALLERDFRAATLVALSEWQALGIASDELFHAASTLQRPAWGHWNGLLLALRRARREVLQTADAATRERILSAAPLAAAVEMLDERLAESEAAAIEPLRAFLEVEKRKRATLGFAFGLPITLRNRIAHATPADPAWWAGAAAALRPLVELHARTAPLARVTTGATLRAPWFEPSGEAAGATWTFVGIDGDSALYRSDAGDVRTSAAALSEVLGAIQRLLGRADLQERDFRDLLAKLAPQEMRGVLLGDYLVGGLARPNAQGGFATVHVGRQLSTGRKVAIKVLKAGMDPLERARFEREAEMLAQFSHPGIVHVFGYDEATFALPHGVDLAGEEWFRGFRDAPRRQFIALEWVDGGTLDDVYEDTKAGRRERRNAQTLATWFLEAARALDAVHAQGLVHRDVKPANLMLTADGHVKLMDFGIAWTLDETRTRFTQTGMNMGTPAYMAPEQVQAKAARDAVGPAADVYGLAATFYELFTGRRLFDHDADPAAATTSKQALKFPSSPRVLTKGLPREMNTILLGGLHPEPAQRYGAAGKPKLSTDLRHFLADEPIEYQPPPLWRRAALAYRRNRLVTHLVAGFVVAAVAGTIVYISGIERERRATTEALVEVTKQRDRSRALGLTAASQAQLATVPMRALLLAREAVRLDPSASAPSNALREAIARSHEVSILRGHAEEALTAAFSPDGSRIVTASKDKTARVWDVAGKELAVLRGHEGRVQVAEFSPDGSRIVTTSDDKTARVWDIAGKELAVLRGPAVEFYTARFSPDGSKIVTAGDHTARLWDLTGRELAVLKGHDRNIATAEFSPDGSTIVTAGEKTARLWDLAGKELAVMRGHGYFVRAATFARDGLKIVTSGDKTARVWDLAGVEIAVLRGHEGTIRAVAISPDASRIVTACDDGTARVWDLSGKELAVLRRHEDGVVAAAFSPDGTKIVTGSRDRAVRVWDLSGKELAVLHGHEGSLNSAAFSPDGSKIVTAGGDDARVWDVAVKEPTVLRGHAGPVASATFSPDQTRIVTVSNDHTARIWDVEGRELAVLRGHEWRVGSAAFSPDGTKVVTAGGQTARVWDLAGTEVAVMRGHEGIVNAARFSSDGSRIVTASDDRTARVWDLAGRERTALRGHRGVLIAAEFSPDGSRIVTADWGGTGRVWDITGRELAVMRTHVEGAQFSPDGSRIVTTGGKFRIWDRDGRELAVLGGHEIVVDAAAFSPDGSKVVTASGDGTCRVWNLEGKVLAVLRGHEGGFTTARFSRDGSRIVAASADSTARVWSVEGDELAVLRGHEAAVRSAEFSTDGTKILTSSEDGTARLWLVRAEDLLRLADSRATREFTDQERKTYAELLGNVAPAKSR